MCVGAYDQVDARFKAGFKLFETAELTDFQLREHGWRALDASGHVSRQGFRVHGSFWNILQDGLGIGFFAQLSFYYVEENQNDNASEDEVFRFRKPVIEVIEVVEEFVASNGENACPREQTCAYGGIEPGVGKFL